MGVLVIIIGLAAGVCTNVIISRILNQSTLFFSGKRNEALTKRLFARHVAVLIFNALFYWLLYMSYGPVIHVIPKWVLFSSLTVISVVDMKTKEIPNGSVLAVLLSGVFNVMTDPAAQWLSGMIGFFVVSVPLLLIAVLSKGGIGGGDIKLMAAAGLFMGWQGVLTAFVQACLAGGITGFLLLIIKRKKGKDTIPFGPFLAAGIVITLLCGHELFPYGGGI